MTMKEKKIKILEELLELQTIGPNEDRVKKLQSLFMEDTHQGKLYKYRTFDKKGYSLKNLSEKTLHCTPPDAFNDPFDCKIGIDYQSLFDALLAEPFKDVEKLLLKVASVLRGDKTLNDFDSIEQSNITKVLNSSLGKLCEAYINPNDLSEQPEIKLIEQPQILIEILNVVFEKSPYKSQLEVIGKMLPTCFANLTKEGITILADEKSTFSDFARVNGIEGDLDEIDLVNKLHSICVPDNEESTEKAKVFFKSIGENLIEKMNSLINVGCLCTDFKNHLMWSHYADSHHGFCVEYDYSSFQFAGSPYYPLPVIYSNTRPKVPWSPFLHRNEHTEEIATRDLTKVLLTKDDAWEYENEWRILVPTKHNPDVCLTPISCIYLGASCSEKDKNRILKIAQKIKVPVKQMVIDRGEYQLRVKDVLVF